MRAACSSPHVDTILQRTRGIQQVVNERLVVEPYLIPKLIVSLKVLRRPEVIIIRNI